MPMLRKNRCAMEHDCHCQTENIRVLHLLCPPVRAFFGEMRPQGTNLIIEDVCFPPAQLANATRDLLGLLVKHGYEPSAAGHPAYGNLHFVMIAQLSEESSRPQYGPTRQMRCRRELSAIGSHLRDETPGSHAIYHVNPHGLRRAPRPLIFQLNLKSLPLVAAGSTPTWPLPTASW